MEFAHEKISHRIKALLRLYLPSYKAMFPELAQGLSRRCLDFYEEIVLKDKTERLMPNCRDRILKRDETGKSHPFATVWWARCLQNAKGRRERAWYAPKGGLFLCVSIYASLLPHHTNLYSLAVPVAICDELLTLDIDPEIRWLNDILIEGRKVGGILSESVITRNLRERYILFGIGLNVNIDAFPDHIAREAGSLSLNTGKVYDIPEMGCAILARMAIFFSILHQWESRILQGETVKNPVLERYRNFSRLCNRRVIYGIDIEKKGGASFITNGIDETGSLILMNEIGETFRVSDGEIRFTD